MIRGEHVGVHTFHAMTLVRLVRRLEHLPADMALRVDDDEQVGGIGSYRGFYAWPALEPFEAWHEKPLATVGELLAAARAAIGTTVQGFKGGTYVLQGDDPLWFSLHGTASGTRPVAVEVVDGEAVIVCCSGLNE